MMINVPNTVFLFLSLQMTTTLRSAVNADAGSRSPHKQGAVALVTDHRHDHQYGKKEPRSPQNQSFQHFSLGQKSSKSTRAGAFEDSASSKANVQVRIIGGDESDAGEFPYYVSLDGCGGSLIGPSVVLSAAHCAPGGSELEGDTVRVGAFQFQENNSDGSVTVSVATQANHPNYNDNTVQNDFMLLRLAQPVQIPNMPMLELSNNLNDIADDTPLTVLGLGITSASGGGSNPNQLMDVEVQANSNAECVNAYGNDPFDGVDINTMFCAGVQGGGKDSCSGDSGGPIIRVVGNTHRQVGVVSWGIECATAEFPGVYAKIPDAGYSWIQQLVCDQWGETSSICDNNGPTPTSPPVPPPTPPPVPSPTQPPVPNPTPSPTILQTSPPVPGPTPAPVDDKNCNSDEILVEFDLTLDDYPDETSWEIYDNEGIVYMRGGPYSDSQSFASVSESKCLPATNCYLLIIYDDFGDGLESTYEVLVDGTAAVTSGDGVFEYSINHYFNCDRVRDGTCVPLVMDLVTDDFSEETHFYLIDMATQSFLWAEDNFSTYETAQFAECLDPSRCYNLDVFDDYGDGIQGAGAGIKITYDGVEVYKGGDIGYGEVFRFGC